MDIEQHLTPDELGERLNISAATILRLFHEGILPGMVISSGKKRKTVRFKLSTIQTWEKSHEKNVKQ